MNPRALPTSRTWYRIVNKAEGAEVYLYDEIGAWGISAGDFAKELAEVTAGKIDLRLNTPGGEVFDGLAIFNALQRHPARITVHVDGIAASIASVIAMAGDEILVDRYAQMMIHEAHAIAVGSTKDMTAMARLLDEYSANIASIYATRAGGDASTWRDRMKAETWFSAAEAVKAGLADRIAEATVKGRPAATWDLSIFNHAGREHAPDPFAAARPTEAMKPMPDMTPDMFAVGDRVRVSGTPHEPGQSTGTVALVQMGPAYGIRFDGAGDLGDDEMDDIHRWYVGDELTPSGRADPAPMTNMACPVHDTPTAEGTWDAAMHEGRMPSPMSVAMAKRFYAWYDPSKIEDAMMPHSAGKLPHHEVSTDGSPGAANLAGVRNALSRLPQSDIPDADVEAVRAHLRAHLGAAEDHVETVVNTVVTAPPEPEAVVFDPQAFRASMAAALRVDYDPAQLRELMASVAGSAPAPPSSPPRPVDLGPSPEPATAPPQPEANPWAVIATAVRMAADDAPAPPDPPTPDPATEPGFLMDASAFRTALRRATL